MILKLESFCNEKGMLVQQRTYVSGDKHPFQSFVGTVGVKIEDSNDPNAMQTIEFPIEVDTIELAFEHFKEAANEKIEKIRKEQEEKVNKAFESLSTDDGRGVTETDKIAPGNAKPTSAKKQSGIVVVKKKKDIIKP